MENVEVDFLHIDQMARDTTPLNIKMDFLSEAWDIGSELAEAIQERIASGGKDRPRSYLLGIYDEMFEEANREITAAIGVPLSGKFVDNYFHFGKTDKQSVYVTQKPANKYKFDGRSDNKIIKTLSKFCREEKRPVVGDFDPVDLYDTSIRRQPRYVELTCEASEFLAGWPAFANGMKKPLLSKIAYELINKYAQYHDWAT